MKIMACKNCGKGYFKNVSLCPHCGKTNKPSVWVRRFLIGSFITLCVLGGTYLWSNLDSVLNKVASHNSENFDLDFDKENWPDVATSETENYWLYRFNKDSKLNITSINVVNSALNVVKTRGGGSKLQFSILLTKDKAMEPVIALQSNQKIVCKASKCSFRAMFDGVRRDIFEFTPIENGKNNSILVIKSGDFLEKIKGSRKLNLYLNIEGFGEARYMFVTQNLNTTF